MFRRWILPVLAILVAGFLGAWFVAAPRVPGPPPVPPAAAPSPPTAPSTPAPALEPPFTFLFGGEIRGRNWVEPCSLAGDGGLGHATTAVDEIRLTTEVAMLLDTGDVRAAPGEAGAVEYAGALEFLRHAGPSFLAVGETDLAGGLDSWREVKNRHGHGVTVLCANLRDAQDRPLVPGAAPHIVGKRRVVVTAVLSPSFEKGLRDAGVPVKLLPPAASVREALATAGKADFVVLIAHCPFEESRALAKELTEVDAVVAAHLGPEQSLAPVDVDGMRLLPAAPGWRIVGGASFQETAAGKRPVLLDCFGRPAGGSKGPGGPGKSMMEGVIGLGWKPGVLEKALRAASEREKRAAYAGPVACASCHPAAHEALGKEGAPHVRSMERVKAKGFDRMHQCLACHATAAGRRGGHLVAGDDQAAVTCEACHGPGADHAASGGKARLADAKASCVACHVPEMSPVFSYDEAWPKVKHGK